MALNLCEKVKEFLESNPVQRFTAREIATWVFETYPEQCRKKQTRSTATVNPIDNDHALLQQLVSEIDSQRPRLQKRYPQIKTTEGRSRKYYYDAIMDMVSPIVGNAEKVRQSIGIYRGISKHAKEINKEKQGHFFAVVQSMAIDTMVMSTFKIYDTSNKKYKKHTIPELVDFLIENKCSAKIRNPDLLKKLGVESLDDIKSQIPSSENSSCLKSLFVWRDKVVAHQENTLNNYEAQNQLKGFPSIDEIEEINNWSFSFCELFVDIFNNDTMLDTCERGSSRMATLNIIRKVLSKPLDGFEEVREFYS
ncbi:MAG: hypothetical protein WC989_07935 [Micavibrio sp.]